MVGTAYLIFELHGVAYAAAASRIREVFYLPELLPMAEAPPEIAGVLNLRGEILPVLDLDRRFGRRPPPYRLTDSVVVLQGPAGPFGAIVNGVREVREITPEDIIETPTYGQRTAERGGARVIMALARCDREMVALLDPDLLITLGEGDLAPLLELPGNGPGNGNGPLEPPPEAIAPPSSDWIFCPDATDADREVFRRRAEHLRQRTLLTERTDEVAVAAITLGNEAYALPLDQVREFIEVRKIAPMPCCPPHILGNTNLRGDIVPVVDVRSFLDLPPVKNTRQAAIVEAEGIVAAIAVDGVLDIYNLDMATVAPVPTALQGGDRDYLHGVVRHGDRVIGLLHLSKLFSQEGFVINETLT
ncbi:MAG: chemotaxis protein CheW [Cyanobacteria bacterium]|nr:chemotaxis protein CheW [Cyanobacteriota bacterium]